MQRGSFHVDIEVANSNLARFAELYPWFVVGEIIDAKLPERTKVCRQTIGIDLITEKILEVTKTSVRT